jgi:hypothetical protein
MAQYPQGIFQSLQFLLKRVKILALQKQPTYTSISTASAPYVIPGRGIYEITTASGTNAIVFPDPTFCNGQTITIINTSGGGQSINPTNAPYTTGTGNVINTLSSLSYYTFVSINDKWVGGKLS